MNAQTAKGGLMNENISFASEHRNKFFWFFLYGTKRTLKDISFIMTNLP